MTGIAKFFVLFCLIWFILPNIPSSAAQNSLIISEINYSGSVQPNLCKSVETLKNRCGFDKWMEIYNPTSTAINLKNWKIQFKNSKTATNTLTLTKTEYLQAKSYYLIAYDEVNFVSGLKTAKIKANLTSGKLRNISNNETNTVQAKLINPNGTTVFNVNLSATKLVTLENQVKPGNKYSIEYKNDSWQLSAKSYLPNNYGTPKTSVVLTTAPKTEPEVKAVIVPQPLEATPTPITKPAIEKSPEMIQPKITNPTPEPLKIIQQTPTTIKIPETAVTTPTAPEIQKNVIKTETKQPVLPVIAHKDAPIILPNNQIIEPHTSLWKQYWQRLNTQQISGFLVIVVTSLYLVNKDWRQTKKDIKEQISIPAKTLFEKKKESNFIYY